MAITPKQVEERFLRANKNLLKNLERKIDNALVKDFRNGNDAVYIDAKNLEYPIVEKITKMYRRAGWDVDYRCDQREGDFLIFAAGRDI